MQQNAQQWRNRTLERKNVNRTAGLDQFENAVACAAADSISSCEGVAAEKSRLFNPGHFVDTSKFKIYTCRLCCWMDADD
ncbi:uncharacterized protein LOC143024052 isoform X2 [Oratosquilla oratoria]|uniref:uncharacterized protein LOC143024052 isoform X2 n=1 Tax=Oratosquilla oratoria TaxID=337810 RepID=UPI003F75FBB9